MSRAAKHIQQAHLTLRLIGTQVSCLAASDSWGYERLPCSFNASCFLLSCWQGHHLTDCCGAGGLLRAGGDPTVRGPHLCIRGTGADAGCGQEQPLLLGGGQPGGHRASCLPSSVLPSRLHTMQLVPERPPGAQSCAAIPPSHHGGCIRAATWCWCIMRPRTTTTSG